MRAFVPCQRGIAGNRTAVQTRLHATNLHVVESRHAVDFQFIEQQRRPNGQPPGLGQHVDHELSGGQLERRIQFSVSGRDRYLLRLTALVQRDCGIKRADCILAELQRCIFDLHASYTHSRGT